MQEGLAVVIFTPLIGLTLVALFLVASVVFGSQVSAVRAIAASSPGRSFGIGVLNIVLITILLIALLSLEDAAAGIFQLLGLIVLALLAVVLTFALAGMGRLIGDRLLPDSSPVRQQAWGSTLLVAACLMPLIGWFLLFPYLVFRGTGALIISLYARSA